MKSVSVARNSPVDTRAPGTCVRRCRDVRVCVSARNHAAAPPLMAAVDPRAPWKPPSSHRATRPHRRSLAAPSRRPACQRRSSLSLFRLCMLRATTTLDRVEATPQVLALAHERPHRARQRNNARGDSHAGRQTPIVPVIRRGESRRLPRALGNGARVCGNPRFPLPAAARHKQINHQVMGALCFVSLRLGKISPPTTFQ